MSLDGAKLASGRTGSLRKAGPRGYQDCYAFPRTTTTRTRSLPASFRPPAVGRRYRIALGVSDSSPLQALRCDVVLAAFCEGRVHDSGSGVATLNGDGRSDLEGRPIE